MGSTFSSFLNSQNPFRDASMDNAVKIRQTNEYDAAEMRLINVQGKNYITSLERHAKHALPHNIRVMNSIKKSNNRFATSMAQPNKTDYPMASGRSSDGGRSNHQSSLIDDQYQSTVSAFGANQNQVRVLMSELSR